MSGLILLDNQQTPPYNLLKSHTEPTMLTNPHAETWPIDFEEFDVYFKWYEDLANKNAITTAIWNADNHDMLAVPFEGAKVLVDSCDGSYITALSGKETYLDLWKMIDTWMNNSAEYDGRSKYVEKFAKVDDNTVSVCLGA